jgi:hypothetical protein
LSLKTVLVAACALIDADGEGQRLAWVKPNQLRNYPMPPADEPLVAHLSGLL